jgi:hypothetical protein
VWLLIIYAGLVVLGEGTNYLICLMIERMWGSQASLIPFLALYFVVLWLAWIGAVKITEPRGVARVAQG